MAQAGYLIWIVWSKNKQIGMTNDEASEFKPPFLNLSFRSFGIKSGLLQLLSQVFMTGGFELCSLMKNRPVLTNDKV